MPPEFEKVGHDTEITAKEKHLDYKGVRIFGLSDTEDKSFGFKEVSTILDRFPDSYWSQVRLREIHFEDYEVYSANRSNENQSSEVIYGIPAAYSSSLDMIRAQIGKIEVLNSSDDIITRKRGLSTTNDSNEPIIVIFSTNNWDNKHDTQFDIDNSLFILVHELGHLTWQTLFKNTSKDQNPALNRDSLKTFALLPVSTLPRFVEYLPKVQTEFTNADNGQKNLVLLTKEEDFAVSHEHYFYWQDLAELDKLRSDNLSTMYSQF
jgi:hypothetical protein